ncbi:hypothetical protein BUALT_Bualt13G0086200 [Buddleja alternifolia]|uniref:SOSEKI DIX-like domain-containing protein n=1 Tax=Buddleja alternifolia TaxID=168488 RepID=A0AAV6WMW3_9LAMI|nr:hypothetical protein BUALT_Bualt13G0086200 [Buddleja alternifolia]
MARSGRMREVWREQKEISPERTIVWTEPSNAAKMKRVVPVVYYLSRNGQLEHPHFMEVPVSSSQVGLYLKDVINRLNVLRGIGMASMYSWSCKRSYKNGFVWHDLAENDFIYPAHGHEYVLKGSELPVNTFLETVHRQQPRLLPPESQIAAAVSDEDYSDRRRRNQSCSSIDFNLHEYSVYKAESAHRSAAAADASTQTDDNRRRRRRPAHEIVEEKRKEPDEKSPHGDEIEIEISPPPSDSSPETLEKLMKADGRLILRPETGKEDPTASSPQIERSKSSVLMQLISCGSVSFKDCGAGNGGGMGGLMSLSQYKMRVPRGGRVKLEEKEYFSGSLVEETKKDDHNNSIIFPALKRSTSYNAGR